MPKPITGYFFKRGDTYWCRFRYQNRDYPFSLKSDKEAYARDEMKREMTLRKAAMIDGTFAEKYGRDDDSSSLAPLPSGRPLLLRDAWRRYVQCRTRPQSGPTTLKQYEYQVTTFVEWMKTHHRQVTDIAAVTLKMACGFLDYIERKGVSANTYNKHVELLRRVFRVLQGEAEALDRNPWDGIQCKKESPNGRKPFSIDDMMMILNKATGWLKTIFYLGFYTGQRLVDCCMLCWEDVSFELNQMLVVPVKTKNTSGLRVDLPLHPDLREHLLELKARASSPTGYVLPDIAAWHKRDSSSLVCKIQGFLVSCGFQIHREGTGLNGIRAVVQYGFHSCRHTWVSVARMAGVAGAVIQAIVGKSYPIYTHISMDAKREAVNAIPSAKAEERVVSSTPVGCEYLTDDEIHRRIEALRGEAERRLRIGKSEKVA